MRQFDESIFDRIEESKDRFDYLKFIIWATQTRFKVEQDAKIEYKNWLEIF